MNIICSYHDEVVQWKGFPLYRNERWLCEDKFPQARALYLYMYAHPGIKLSFMGNELGAVEGNGMRKGTGLNWWIIRRIKPFTASGN